MRSKIPVLLACVAGLASAHRAAADGYYTADGVYVEPEQPAMYAWSEPTLETGIGVGVVIGGGVAGFTGQTMRDTMSSSVGGLWDARVTLGTHTPLALDISYLGTATDIDTIRGAPNGTLVGTTVEGALRFNIAPHYWFNPYIFAGVGYQRYDVQNVQFSEADSGMASSDNLVEFPMGAGLSWRDPSGFMFDLRGTYRQAGNSDLVVSRSGTGFADLSWWAAEATLGYEF